MREGRLWRSGVVLVALAVTLAACSSSDSESDTTVPQTSSTRDTTRRSTTTTEPTTTTSLGETTTTTTTTSTVGTPAPPPDTGTGPIGVVGCSNTDLSVAGYNDLSDLDRMSTGDLGGGSVPFWGDPAEPRYGEYWALYDDRRPADGYTEAWVELCIRTSEHLGSFDEDEQNWVTHIVDQIHQRDPGIPVWVSPLNFYADGVVCESVGPDGPAISAEAADWAAANLENTFRGPDLGPLSDSDLGNRDDCHPNQIGQRLLGEQLVEFFD